jgi:MFS_1 like family
LIASFAVYILRYTGLAILDAPWWTLSMEVLEPVTLGLTWVTIVMYFRHIIPRRLTATGQAIPVIAHFCLGKLRQRGF